jgi:hypothetical protein
VQVIKPPFLLEIYGPLCMSSAALNHLQYRLTSEGKTTLLQFTHRAVGDIPERDRQGMPNGWGRGVDKIRERAEQRS